MALEVEIWTVNDQGDEERVGVLRFEGTTIVANPPTEPLLQDVLTGSWPLDVGGEGLLITATKNPDLLIRNAYKIFRSHALRATEAREVP
jgi:hypothetical protein